MAAIAGGFLGALTLTLLHETIRRLTPDAPRMDRLGMEAISKGLQSADADVPEENSLFNITMAGDIISNSLYYSLAGAGKKSQAVLNGVILGSAAGIGALFLPKTMGLNEAAATRTFQTKLMTVALYITGGLAAGIAAKIINDKILH